MPTHLTTARHLDGLHEAVTAFVAYAGRAGLDAPVPTCPDWTVLDLVAHQGMVHRWAAALVRGERPSDEEVEGPPVEREPGSSNEWEHIDALIEPPDILTPSPHAE